MGYTTIYAHWNMADSLSSNVFVTCWQNVTNPSYLWSKSSFSSVDHIVVEIWNVNSIWMGRVISTDKVWDYYIHFPFMEMDHYPGSDISATKIATNWASNHLFTAWHHFVIFDPNLHLSRSALDFSFPLSEYLSFLFCKYLFCSSMHLLITFLSEGFAPSWALSNNCL